MPTVSVVITCYNYGKYLEGCLMSVIKQTYKDIEIIVVDDGSTDNTIEVMGYFKETPNIIYIWQENSGQTRAKNVGIKSSTGNYVAFLDADDRWCPDKLEKQMTCFENDKNGVVYCRAKYLDENDQPLDYEMTDPYLQPRRGFVTDWLFYNNFVQFSSTVVRKECFEKFGTFDESLKMAIDWDLWLRLSTAYTFDYVDERLFYYRMGHSGQMSRNVEERQRCCDRIKQKFLMKYPDLLTRQTVRKANAIFCCNRGEYFRKINKEKSAKYFWRAISNNPVELRAYKGLIKNLLQW